MNFERIDQIEDALMGGRVDLRSLYEIWERREPVPDPLAKKTGKSESHSSSQIAWMQWKAALLPKFTAQAFAAGEYLLVCDVAREAAWLEGRVAESDLPYYLRVRLDHARALERLGGVDEALAQLAGFGEASIGRSLKAEGLEMRGNLTFERARLQTSEAARNQLLDEARNDYLSAIALDDTRFGARIWLAAAAQMHATTQGEKAPAEELLRALDLWEREHGPSFCTAAARAHALLILGKEEAAVEAYAKLKDARGATTSLLADTRHEATLLAEVTGHTAGPIRSAFPRLELLVFAGHLPRRGQPPSEWSPEKVQEAREAIRKTLADHEARVGLSAAAAGSDLLFLEELQARNGLTHVILPWSREEFLETSIRPFDGSEDNGKIWEPMFDRALKAATSVRELGQLYRPESEIGLQYTTEVTAGIALLTARAARLDIQPLALWDGHDGPIGGTAAFVSFWRSRLGREPVIIDPPATASASGSPIHIQATASTEQRIPRQEVKTMLFADIVGYSKLTEKVIPEFSQHFLGRVAQLAASSRHAPRSVNTWGDALYAVFDRARDGGCFALEVIQMIRDNAEEWRRLGLSWMSQGVDGPVQHPLNIRIGLHTGPVFLHYDPVVSRLGYTGSQVSRAARIEPVTRAGEVYVSEEFAALVELAEETERQSPQGESGQFGFTCEYAGSMRLAKDYPGRFRIYRLLPRIEFHIEPLARAIHEEYCRVAEGRGETPATNPVLRPWEQLPEDVRDANRAQAADIPQKLRNLGYKLSTLHGVDPNFVTFPDDAIEDLAKREHVRWSSERRRQGWTYAPKRDNERKHHPLLVPWEELNEIEREKDRATARNAAKLAAKAGFRLLKL